MYNDASFRNLRAFSLLELLFLDGVSFLKLNLKAVFYFCC